MPRSRRLRRRPSTPNLQQAGSFFTANPASPPETPTRLSQFSRKKSLKPRHQLPFAALADDPHIQPVGNGHQFSYRPSIGPAQLSPRDSSSDSSQAVESSDEDLDNAADEDDDEKHEDEEGNVGQHMPMELNRSRYEIFLRKQSQSDSEEESDEDDGQRDDNGSNSIDATKQATSPKTSAMVWDIVLEDMDPMDPGSPALEVLYPYEIEGSRSGTPSLQRDGPDISRPTPSRFNRAAAAVASSSSSSEDSDEDSDDSNSDDDDACTADLDPERAAFERHQEHMRRLRRVSMSSSVGKRTHSELSDDSDDEFLDVNDVGSSARRFRKRLHRSSLLFHDPPQKIVELEEPNSSEDEWVIRAKAGRKLAQELPYFWEMEVSEVESSYEFTFTVEDKTK